MFYATVKVTALLGCVVMVTVRSQDQWIQPERTGFGARISGMCSCFGLSFPTVSSLYMWDMMFWKKGYIACFREVQHFHSLPSFCMRSGGGVMKSVMRSPSVSIFVFFTISLNYIWFLFVGLRISGMCSPYVSSIFFNNLSSLKARSIFGVRISVMRAWKRSLIQI